VCELRCVAPCCLLVFALTGNAHFQTKTGAKAQAHESGDAHFVKGKELIENNCIDCMGGTQAGMEQGIREVEAALQAGYRNKKAAYELLSDAYAHMTTYRGRNPEEANAYSTKRRQIDRKLFELYPNDPDVLERYESWLENDTEKVEILKRLLMIKPNPNAQFVLGDLLMVQGNVKEGLPLVRSAIATEGNDEAVINYVERLIDQLEVLGCPVAEAGSWRHRVNTAWEKATRGAGDPNAMPEFKKNFSAALDLVNCNAR
jgi:hypothetical protein